MSQDNAADFVAVLQKISDVGNDNIYAQQLGFREHQPGINHDDVVAPAHGHAVHPELAQATKGY